MKTVEIRSDITVVGGGLAGICAAIAAARQGRTVVLAQNRPVLGGNSSSEIRVPVAGANGMFHNRFARETGIIGELLVENQYRNQPGNPVLWDALLLEWVRAESNIKLLLNTDVRTFKTRVTGDGIEIVSAIGWTLGSEIEARLTSNFFIDCTGDGFVGAATGAQFRVGREARAETGEAWAQEKADKKSLGSTMFLYTKDAGRSIPFVPPSFAIDITKTTIPLHRIEFANDSGAKYWWIEYGGHIDTIHDNEAIRDELLGIVYGVWDYIKNSGKYDADTLTLEWISAIPGKRESRRLVGDYVLTQTDVVNQRSFPDAVTFGGWSVDLHHPDGVYATDVPDRHMFADGVFDIPLRCLYSANVANLLFAGRNVSTTHAGNGAIRVMGTCAAMGEAAGTTAALCVEKSVHPRLIVRDSIGLLQQRLLKADATIIGVRNEDADDKAQRAEVSASSHLDFIETMGISRPEPLLQDLGIVLPVDPILGPLELLVDVTQDTELVAEIWGTSAPQNYVPDRLIQTHAARLEKGENQWCGLPLDWNPNTPCNAVLVVRRNPEINLHMTADPVFGIQLSERKTDLLPKWYAKNCEKNSPPGVIEWSIRERNRQLPRLRTLFATEAYKPEKVVNGHARPFGGPNLWQSSRPARDQWLNLAWPEQVEIAEVWITFNDDVNERLYNLHRYETPFRTIPEIVRDYRIQVLERGEWHTLIAVSGNRQRRRKHRFPKPVLSSSVRIVIDETNGSEFAQIVEVRVY
uniref:Fumarate reductase/succinate dehydrogenase flavoprotein-like protein n=1 Tax=Chelativorans sp. (strain BNC1) TaxID=266779 RepID=Q11FY6_CHESB